MIDFMENTVDKFKSVYHSIRSFYYGVKNIIRWMPTIYNDRDWDHAYLLCMLQKKLEHMSEYFKSENTCSMDSHLHAEKIDECVTILKNLVEENYDKHYNDVYEEYKYLHGLEDKPMCDWFKNFTEEAKSLYLVRTKIAFTLDDEEKRNDTKKLFSTLEKELFQWWD
jgi:hypothetical protein